jgi:phospholipase A-2-activating protein
VTASRDGTSKTWKQTSPKPLVYESFESSHGAVYKSCLAFVPPNKKYPEGLIVCGGQDAIIEARQPSTTAENDPDGLMIGHAHSVACLDVNVEEGYIVSGSWDGTAKLWRIGQWEPEVDFPGHQGAVWAVVAYNNEFVVTGTSPSSIVKAGPRLTKVGCADMGIRVFDTNRAKIMAEFSAREICRALAKIPEGHVSGGQLLSASNDSVIRVWTLKGDLLSELHGHEAFIYSLAVLPDGRFVSSGEDRSVRIWQDNTCTQTITLPALSVWSVSTCSNGDIIAGSSDKTARIFTTDPNRIADAAAQAELSESVKASTIARETVGEVKKTDLPGPDFLQSKSGTKDGQTQMIKEDNGSVTAHQWSTASQSWTMIGTVVDSAENSQKKTYQGKDYDYVFDVDIEDGKPPIKLPYNVTQNPHEVATKWLQDHGMPLTYLEETANFIVKNTQGATLGTAGPSGPDPLGTESRYRPGEASTYQPPANTFASTKKLPQKEYVSIVAGKPEATHQQILKLNRQYTESRASDFALSESDLDALSQVFRQLQNHHFDGKSSLPRTPALEACLPVAVRIATQWQPPTNRLAGLDLLRFLAVATPDFPDFEVKGEDVVTLVTTSGVFDPDIVSTNTKLAMVAIRLFANLMFGSEMGRGLLEAQSDLVLRSIKSMTPACARDSALAIAVTTYYLNLAVWLTRPESTRLAGREDRALTIVEAISQILEPFPAVDTKATGNALQQATEPVYRGLFAVGTVLVGLPNPDLKEAARSIFNIDTLLSNLRQKGYFKEARFQGLVEEIQAALA